MKLIALLIITAVISTSSSHLFRRRTGGSRLLARKEKELKNQVQVQGFAECKAHILDVFRDKTKDDISVCTSTADIVFKALTGSGTDDPVELKLPEAKAQILASTTPTAHHFEIAVFCWFKEIGRRFPCFGHHMIVLFTGTEYTIIQSFVSVFTVLDWLEPKANICPLCSKYQGALTKAKLNEFFTDFEALIDTPLQTANFPKFETGSKDLFGFTADLDITDMKPLVFYRLISGAYSEAKCISSASVLPTSEILPDDCTDQELTEIPVGDVDPLPTLGVPRRRQKCFLKRWFDKFVRKIT
jgi:hypothetical protein